MAFSAVRSSLLKYASRKSYFAIKTGSKAGLGVRYDHEVARKQHEPASAERCYNACTLASVQVWPRHIAIASDFFKSLNQTYLGLFQLSGRKPPRIRSYGIVVISIGTAWEFHDGRMCISRFHPGPCYVERLFRGIEPGLLATALAAFCRRPKRSHHGMLR
jgi:hypothetical protein